MENLTLRSILNNNNLLQLNAPRSLVGIISFLIILPVTTSSIADLPTHSPVPGGVAVLTLAPLSLVRPIAHFGNRELLVVKSNQSWVALVGLPCEILPGNYIVRTEDDEGEVGSVELAVFPIAPKIENAESSSNQAQYAGIKQSSLIVGMVEPDDSSLFNQSIKPVARERAVFSGRIRPDFEFVPIVDSRETVPYGKLIQGKRTITHDYISYLGTPGDQVYSPAAGNVVEVIESADNGFTIHISHGGNVFSILGHLAQVSIHEGQPLDAGEQVGSTRQLNIGERGKLDWGLQMNGFLVNPFLLSRKVDPASE
jgi:hypothetical protein